MKAAMEASTSSTVVGQLRVSLSPRDIPALSTSLIEVVRIANDPDVSFDVLEQVISRDQALTLRVLAVANSSYYGCSRRVDSARTALALLGTRQVQNIASAMALAPAFDSEYGPSLWTHGLCTAVWTGHVTRALGLPPLDYVFTAALLHDIGIVLLLKSAPELARELLAEARETDRELHDVERERLGTDHAQLGGRASVAWRLPDRIATLVASHHDVEDPAKNLDLAVLQVADELAEHTPDASACPSERAFATLRALGLGVDAVRELVACADKVALEATSFG